LGGKDMSVDLPKDTGPKRWAALDALRGVAVLMVVYDHLFAVAGERMAGAAFAPVPWVRQWVSTPMGIIQDFGWFGVCLFFLISGFVISHAARRESMRVFAVRRVFRIFPPLAVAVAAVALLDVLSGQFKPVSDYLLGVTLAGYLMVPQVIVLGVAWTLVIEVIFYALMALVSPLLKGAQPAAAVALASLVPPLVIWFARDLGPEFFLFAASVAYLPVLLLGSTIYLAKATDTAWPIVWLLALVNWGVFLFGLSTIHTVFLPIQNSYAVSLVYALALFLLCLERQPPQALRRVGDMSYSLYLLHGTVGFAVVQALVPLKAGAATPLVATAVVLVVSWLMYRWVERPSIAWGRRLTAQPLA
jgi:exopolysaccharide production protein ExoZ